MTRAETSAPTRIGMITPSSNTCLEPTTYRLIGGRQDVTVHFARVGVTRIDLDESADRQFAPEMMTAATEQLADAGVDVVVWNGTAGSWLGIDHDRSLVQVLSRVADTPATTSTLALLDALDTYGVTRLGLATPYTEEVNQRIVRTYAAEGVDVVSASALGMTDNFAFALVPERDVAAQLRAVAADTEATAVLCTNVHGAFLAEDLERELGRPVFDSVAVTLWHALGLTGNTTPIADAGTLLRDGHLRRSLQAICARLREATEADRATLRVDMPEHNLHVDLAAAESIRPGVRSIRWEASLDQRQLDTVVWLATNRRNLVQPNFQTSPTPPTALVDAYGVRAQMLGPVHDSRNMAGWLSVHSLVERDWTSSDLQALDRARIEAAQALAFR
jgi:maleate isomerase